MRYNDDILERLGEFYADLELGNWTDYLSGKPKGFDSMKDSEKMHYALHMMVKIDKIMKDPWNVIKTWSRRLTLENPPFDAFDMFMDQELERLSIKEQIHEQKRQEAERKHFWNRLCK